jgi:Glycosyl transferase family 2
MATVKGVRLTQHAIATPRVVITMPAYNAETTLAKTVADIPAGVADQLILVDDASPDNTVQLARALGIDVHVHPENRGYGGNQKTCYSMALRDDADIVVMLHPDYQYEPRAVPLLIAPIVAGDADMTFGSRFAGLGDPRGGGMPVERYIGNRVTTLLENVMLGSRFSEMHSGMRAYSRRCLLSLPYRRYSNNFVFDTQLLADAVTTGQRVIEVPIPTRYTEESSSIGVRSSVSYVAGSLGYCVRRARNHGRRRHRTPRGRRYAGRHGAVQGTPVAALGCPLCNTREPYVAYPESLFRECLACGLVSSDEPSRFPPSDTLPAGESRFLEWIVAAIGGYFVSGNRLLMLGLSDPGSGELAAGGAWDTLDVADAARAAETGLERVDALVIASPHDASVLGGLNGLRSILHPEGILALVLPCLRASKPDRSVRYQVRPQVLDRALNEAGLRPVEWARVPRAYARTFRRGLSSPTRSGVATRPGDVALAIARPMCPPSRPLESSH